MNISLQARVVFAGFFITFSDLISLALALGRHRQLMFLNIFFSAAVCLWFWCQVNLSQEKKQLPNEKLSYLWINVAGAIACFTIVIVLLAAWLVVDNSMQRVVVVQLGLSFGLILQVAQILSKH